MHDKSEIQNDDLQTWVFLVGESPYWISAFRLHHTWERIVSLNFWTLKHGYSRWNWSAILCTDWDISISGLWSDILDCWHPFALHNMGNRWAEFLNFKIHVYSLRNFASMLYTCRASNISSFKATGHLGFPTSVCIKQYGKKLFWIYRSWKYGS
jgi:hypothetical protein